MDPRRIAVGKKTVAGGRMSGRQRGIAGGKNNYQPGASGLVKKPLSCTVAIGDCKPRNTLQIFFFNFLLEIYEFEQVETPSI